MMGAVQVPDDARKAELTRMMQAHGSALVGLCTAMLKDAHLAQDMVQETFIRSYAKMEGFRGEGKPSGFEAWDMEEPGQKYEDVWAYDDPEIDREITEWLNAHESGWIARDSWSLADGAKLADGTDTMILDGGSELVDAYTLHGYQEVELPEGVEDAQSIELVFPILYGTSVYYQDAAGIAWAHVNEPENRGVLNVSFAVSRTGQVRDVSGESDYLIGYVLVDGSKTLRNLDGSLHLPEPGV